MTNYERCQLIKELLGNVAKHWFTHEKRLGWDLTMKNVLTVKLEQLNQRNALHVVQDSWAKNPFLKGDELDVVIEALQEPVIEEESSEDTEELLFVDQTQEFHGQDFVVMNNDCESDAPNEEDLLDLRSVSYEELSKFCFKALPKFWVDRIACLRRTKSGQLTIWFNI